MEKKNILIVDDSALMRRVESDIIKTDDRFQVLDTATNGLEAFDLVTRNSKKSVLPQRLYRELIYG